ncbi:hypothetical protein [Nocardiopsis rhodophaea]|uniref:hypothetical protein n=1 Tax=Nocardiopsis rhodophaea TaxID=280238 RepID=UPI0033754955
MGFVKPRIIKKGKTRYTACYIDIRGKDRSAGTYDTEKEAAKARGREPRPRSPKAASPASATADSASATTS